MNKKAILIGLGMQGQAALYDLVNCGVFSHIIVADSRPDLDERLAVYQTHRVTGVPLDVSDEDALRRLMRGVDIVVEALPAVLVLRMGELAAECGVPLVSSMFYFNPEGLDADAVAAQRARISELDRTAKETDITILSECGMDPGLDLLMARKAVSELDEVHLFNTYGAGLPDLGARNNSLQYKFSWSPVGVMRAYHRGSSMVRDGQPVEVPALEIFEPRHNHRVYVPELGPPLECFPNGDALHYADLLGIRGTVRESGRYTGRYPGHCALWDSLVKAGFLDDDPVPVGGTLVPRTEYMAAMLSHQRQFSYGEDERDLTWIRVEAGGLRAGKPVSIIYELIDYRDLVTGFTAMQRTVGFTMSRGAQLIATGELTRKGLLTPLDVPYEDVVPALEQHGIRVIRTETEL